MIRKSSVIIISLALCGLCLALFVWLKERPADRLETTEHQPEGLDKSTIVDTGRTRSKSVKEEMPLETKKDGIERAQQVEKRTVLSRMPAGHQSAQLLRQEASVNEISVQAITDAVDVITGLTGAKNAERFRAVAALYRPELPETEVTRLLDYLGNENRYTGMSDSEMYALVNEIAAIFYDQPVLLDEYLRVSFEVVENTSEKEVVRDYLLQGLSRGIGSATPEQAEAIKEVFINNLNETETSLAGTALLALRREFDAGNLNDFQSKSFKGAITKYLADEDAGERTRIPAIQIAAASNDPRFIDKFVSIVRSPKSTQSEKAAALSGLAYSNAEGKEEILRRASKSEETLVADVAVKLMQLTNEF